MLAERLVGGASGVLADDAVERVTDPLKLYD
jgi:hypothetical protein